MAKPYPLRKSRRIFHRIHALYKRRWKRLTPSDLKQIEGNLEELDQALVRRDRVAASERAKRVETAGGRLFKKHPIVKLVEFILAIAVALAAATVIRQMWFEPMEIPSGSMRPHFQELDRLIITKTPFGLNIPMTPKHFFFNPGLVKRTGVFIFTSEDMDIPDQNTTYFGIPGKKRLIKRVMGKPGDTLYFYGGKIYGMDAEGRDLTELREGKWAEEITSIPFINFQGKRQSTPQAIVHRQMNQPLGRTLFASRQGQVFHNGKWVNEQPGLTYTTFWGMDNYAMTRLLSRKQASRFGHRPQEEVPLYLELVHHPTLTGSLQPEVSLLPLAEQHLDRLMNHMTTSRFIVKEGRAYAEGYANFPPYLRPAFPDVPDGRYQFTDGALYKVAFSGVLIKQKDNHPLYSKAPSNVQRLFNLGIDFSTALDPNRFETPFPNRYAFYREGDLYILGKPLLYAGEPTLTAFEAAERARTNQNLLYQPFVDRGPPLKEGELDRALLQAIGLKIPEKGYLALGDNYANSGDSRQFGFVPEDNIRGAPFLIFWPAGSRWGAPFMPANRWVTPARLTVWILAIIIGVCWFLWHHRRNRRTHFKPLSINGNQQ